MDHKDATERNILSSSIKKASLCQKKGFKISIYSLKSYQILIFPPRKKSDIYAILVPIVKSMCIFYVIILQTCLKHYKILQNKAQN
jgi:hypothetical protein